MNGTENRDRNRSQYSSNGEDEIDANLLEVRRALLSLPKVACPAGFEYRLNRRLEGLDARPQVAARSWVSGWLGVGLGFACAAIVALFILDFNGPTSVTVPMAGGQIEQTVPVQTSTPSVVQPAPVSQPGNMAATTDSVPLKTNPTPSTSDQLHQVSGAENAPR